MSDEGIEEVMPIQVSFRKTEQVSESMNSTLATFAKDPFNMILCYGEIQERDQIQNVLLLVTQTPARLVWDHLELLSADTQFRECPSSSWKSDSAWL